MSRIRQILGLLSLLFTLLIVAYGLLKGFDVIDLILNISYFLVIIIDQIILLFGDE